VNTIENGNQTIRDRKTKLHLWKIDSLNDSMRKRWKQLST